MIKDFGTKEVNLAIKKNMTMGMLAEKYGCDIREVEDTIRQLYVRKGHAEKAIRKLNANEKKVRPKAEVEAEVEIPTTPVIEEEIESDSALEKLTLKELQEREEELVSLIVDREVQRKDLLSARHNLTVKMRECETSVSRIVEEAKKALRKTREEFTKYAVAADEKGEAANALSNEISEIRPELEAVQKEIEKRTTIGILVHDDGNIEVQSPDFVLNDEGWQELKADLVEREECSELKNRETAVLAKLLKACENVKYVVLACDNAEIEKAFLAIRNTKQLPPK